MVQTLLFFHLAGVAVLLGGIGISLAALVATHRATTLADLRAATHLEPACGPLIVSGVLIVLSMGIALVYAGAYGWQPWLTVACALTIVLTVNGKLINGNRMDAIYALARTAGDGMVGTDIETRRRDPVLNYSMSASAMQLIVLLYIMAVKPPLPACLIAIVSGLVLAFVPAMLLVRKANHAMQTAQG